ncbi:MAG: RNA-guided endonuclease IscB, partial [Acidimicrobiales bacterium]
ANCGRNARHGSRYCRPCGGARDFADNGQRRTRLAPSLRHRVDNTMSMLTRLSRWAPVMGVHLELVRFDTQQMEDPEVSGVEYQQGTLVGFEVREYLLEKWERRCAYCGAEGVPLNLDHITPKSKGGTNRVSNLALACVPCNQEKDNRELTGWLVQWFGEEEGHRVSSRVLATAKAPLKDAAAVNSTRWALHQALKSTGLPVRTGSGGETKWNRTRCSLGKSHALDALCVGDTPGVVSYPATVTLAKATGRGSYSRTRPDAYGFPRLYLPRTKVHHGFSTGDLVRAVVPKGKHQGTHVGRVAVRSSGSFNIKTKGATVQGISHRHCTLLQRGDGWEYGHREEVRASGPSGPSGTIPPRTRAVGFSSHTDS